jgi:hypothetical protein
MERWMQQRAQRLVRSSHRWKQRRPWWAIEDRWWPPSLTLVAAAVSGRGVKGTDGYGERKRAGQQCMWRGDAGEGPAAGLKARWVEKKECRGWRKGACEGGCGGLGGR